MKKTLKTFAFVLLAALAFSSCVDVPAPYNLPSKSSSIDDGGSSADEGISVTCAEAVDLTKALSDGGTSTETYTITGYITEVVGDVSRNQQTFWMADTKDGGRVFEAYWANLPDGVTAFTAGTKVKITGKLMKYVNNSGNVTCEMKNAVVTILEDGGGSTTDEGTPVTCAQAKELTEALADNASSTETYTVTGYITEVVGNVSKNQQTFWMADTKDGGKVFEAYWANLPEGVTEFTVGTKVKITGKLMKYVNNSGNVTCEMKNAVVTILEDGGGSTTDEGTPVTCAQAKELTEALADNASSTETYTVTGYITEVVGNVSKNQQTFWMADTKDGGRVFEAYWANLPEGVTEFKVGMKVKITGNLMKFVKGGEVTPEIKNANVVILEEGGGDTPPAGDAIPVTCAEAVQQTNTLADGATSTDIYAVTGYITEVIGEVSLKTGTPQQSFWMADTKDGGQVFQAYWANLPEDVSAFTVGSKVTITGKLKKYVKSGAVTPEIQNATVEILEAGEGGDTPPGPGGDEVTELVNGGFEEWVSDAEPVGWKSASSASNATLSKSSDAKSESLACFVKALASSNQRLATQEITLEAGSYTFSYYAKSASAPTAQTKGGYVPVTKTNNEYKVGSYKYGDFVNINNNGWTLVSYDFTLEVQTTVCLVIMNPKDTNSSTIQYTAADILIDDATLVKK